MAAPSSAQPPSTLPSPIETEARKQADHTEREEARVAASDPSYSPMTMEEYFDAWYRKATTSLQRDELERQMLGRRVIWSGIVKSVDSESDTVIRIVVEPTNGSYGTAFLDFNRSQRQDLLKLHDKQRIRFTGVIRNYVASPFLSQCTLLRVLN